MHPVLFTIGPLRLYSYGFMVAIGVFCAILFLRNHAKSISVHSETMTDLAITTVISGFLGARIFYVIEFWDHFKLHLLDIPQIWQGGIVLYGGLISGVLGFATFIKIKKLPFFRLLDLFVIAMSLAQGFGRIGCFFNGCCFGKETNLPIGIQFSFSAHPIHPTQLYESAFSFMLAGFLYGMWKLNRKAGFVSLLYFSVYPIGRFLIEYLRGDQAKLLFDLTIAQWISLAILSVAAIISLLVYGKKDLSRSS